MDFHDLRAEVCKHSFAKNPPSQHWLDSDHGTSYCWDCAVIARGHEFELGPVIAPTPFYMRDEWQDLFYAGIDGGDWYSAVEDCRPACARCGCTLHHWLTDEGIADEIAFYEGEEKPWYGDPREHAYAIDRLFEVYSDEKKASVTAIAERFLAFTVEQRNIDA